MIRSLTLASVLVFTGCVAPKCDRPHFDVAAYFKEQGKAEGREEVIAEIREAQAKAAAAQKAKQPKITPAGSAIEAGEE